MQLLWFLFYYGLRFTEHSNWKVIGLVLVLRHQVEKPTIYTLFFFYKNVVFPAQAEYSYFFWRFLG